MKRCVVCGIQQERWRDKSLYEKTNIDPVSGKCIDCLIKAKGTRENIPDAFDAKAAAAGKDE